MTGRRHSREAIPVNSVTDGAVRPLHHSLNFWWLVASPIALFLAIFFCYPTALTLFRAFTYFDAPEQSGFDNLNWVLGSDANRIILIRTFVFAAICTVLCSLIAFPYAFLMTRVSKIWQTILLGLLLVSMFFGLLLRNFSWVVLLQMQGPLNDLIALLGFDRIRLLGTAPAVLMGMVHVLFPFMALPLFAVLKGIDTRLILAAQSLGATPRAAFLQVYLPLALPGVLAGSLLVFVLALGFYITPAVLGSPKQALVSQILFSQFETRAAFGRAGALAIVLLVAASVFVVMANRLQRRSKVYEG